MPLKALLVKEITKQKAHKRLSHISDSYLTETLRNTKGLEIINSKEELISCESCLAGKQHKNIGYKPISNAENPFELIYTDTAGPFSKGLKGEKYFTTFTDDYSKAVWLYSLKFKSDAFDAFKAFYSRIQTQLGYKIQRIRADNALEYKSNSWNGFIKEKGIIMEFTAPYSPEQNGISERLNRTLIERTISTLKEKNIPLFLWPYIVESIGYIKNRTYSRVVNKTPYEVLLNSVPDISNIRILGSIIFKNVPKEKKNSKLDIHTEKGILIGFESTNYKCYIPSRRSIISVRDIEIQEEDSKIESEEEKENYDYNSLSIPEYTNSEILTNSESNNVDEDNVNDNISEDNVNEEENEQNDSLESESEQENEQQISVQIPRRSTRINKGQRSENFRELAQLASKAYVSFNKDEMSSLNEFKEPKSYQEAISSQEKEIWIKSMQEELETLKENNTWKLIDLPNGHKPISTKWVYKIKQNDDKSI